MLNVVLTKPKKGEKSASLGSLRYALVRDVAKYKLIFFNF